MASYNRTMPITIRMMSWMLLAGGFAASAVGCVQRTITVTSQPEGALVYLNDEEVGRTPLTVPFTFYGVYDVRLVHEASQTLNTTREAKAPWYDQPGVDFVSEVLPVDAEVDLVWHFDLQPRVDIDEAAVIERAHEMRAMLRGAGDDASGDETPAAE